ncbi:hypothetical protein J41TS12_45630 [Paenibacillus antibioticophila]|uniref:Uncharacterized protein n=2 Tax=Paenibacillus antibioticophila TaxID=1274374 RepID=A0A920CK79_9BACL|nr:hypothetical protein J41TS12_45630 [Paenibacillus antibioticophila]
MLMPADKENNATFYHYRLLKRLTVPRPLISSFLTLPFMWLAATMVFFSWTSLFYFLLAVPIVLWVHFVIARSVLIIVSHSYRKRWRFSWRLPWLGYLPDQFVTYSTFRLAHLHITWIGICLFAALIPWSPPAFIISLVLWHLWLVAPKLYILIGMRKQPKGGMIKITPQDTSYYMP